MKKRLLSILLCILLLSGCGAAPSGSGPSGAEADPPKQSGAPTDTQTAAPVPTQAPAATPEPASTPEPTPIETAAPSLEDHPLLAAEGIYRLYRSETEGYAVPASESGAEAWVTLRRSGAADYMGYTADGVYREWRCMPCSVDAQGVFRFETPDDFIAYDMTGSFDADGLLELSLSWYNPDGTAGGTTLWFKRVPMNDGADRGLFNGIKLTEEQLSALKSDLDPACMAFCTSVYSCPEEIDWTQVFYDGAGIGEEPSDTALEEYRADGGWMELDMECVSDALVREFVWKHTLTSYDLADHTLFLNWFSSSDGYYLFEHGDTNAIPVDFYDAFADHDLYKLYYMRSNWEDYVFEEIPFVLTVYIRDGQWQYVSNLPADRTEPKTLLKLSYYRSLEDAEAVNNVVSVISPEETGQTEPYDWSYAVFTAQEDGVRYVIEQVDDHVDEGLDVMIPGDYVAGGVLNRGESAVIHTNQPWHAEMRLTVTKGSCYGSYVFGEDNWKHLHYEDVRGIVCHDLAGEGRGCAPKTEAELSAFLRDGGWALLDTVSGELVASVRFHDYRYLSFRSPDGSFEAFLNFDRYDARPTQAPDLIVMEYSDFSEEEPQFTGFHAGDPIGDYQLYMIQLDGEQILTLTQVSEGEGIFSVVCPWADEGGVFTLYRYRGAAGSEGQG